MKGRAFAIGTFSRSDETPFAGIIIDGRVTRLEAHLGAAVSVRGLLEHWSESFRELQALADQLTPEGCEHRLDELRPLIPVQPPGQLFQAGANYKQHLVELLLARQDRSHDLTTDAERRKAIALLDERARTGAPYVFVSNACSLAGAEDDVVLPAEVRQPDWELELAVVIGQTAKRISREHALDVVAGYTICNDITARDRVFRPDILGIGTDWLAGKGWATFSPVGPYLVPAEHVGNPQNLQIKLRLNGEVMQDSSTADMMFDIARLIEYTSSITELHPGDLLLTGSPSGNGVHHGRFLSFGDVLEGEITGLGTQRNRCVLTAPAPAPEPARELQA
jgi:2,4-diketo-3-deoxy-L-fuconate hydrolase